MSVWTQSDALEMCRVIETFCPASGCHVALTGGLLYKAGMRKDCDILFYRIRQLQEINMEQLWESLSLIGFQKQSGFGWCFKATYKDKPVDCFFPEEQGGPTYEEETGLDAADTNDLPLKV